MTYILVICGRAEENRGIEQVGNWRKFLAATSHIRFSNPQILKLPGTSWLLDTASDTDLFVELLNSAKAYGVPAHTAFLPELPAFHTSLNAKAERDE